MDFESFLASAEQIHVFFSGDTESDVTEEGEILVFIKTVSWVKFPNSLKSTLVIEQLNKLHGKHVLSSNW